MRLKVKGALASTFLRGEVDLRVKVRGAFASTFLRVRRLASESQRSSWWTQARQHRNKLFRSGNGTSRSSSRGGGEGKSWRGVVEAAAEVRLMILAHSRLLIYPRRLEVTIWLLSWVVINRVKSLWES